MKMESFVNINQIAIIFIILFPSICFAGDFDNTDKALFTGLCAAQIFDGMTTAAHLDDGEHIMDTWAWKYGTNKPSSARLWGVKAAELGLAYVIAKNLDGKYRKTFLIGTTALLLYCGASNELEFKITF